MKTEPHRHTWKYIAALSAGTLVAICAYGFGACNAPNVDTGPQVPHVDTGAQVPHNDGIFPPCENLTDEERDGIRKEIEEYQSSARFHDKIKEVKGEATPLHRGIDTFLREHALRPEYNVLELGCAAGLMLKLVREAFQDSTTNLGKPGALVGVELVPGWVEFAQEYLHDISIYEGDITAFSLPPPHDETKFDLVMFNDVMEHVQKNRYSCLLSKLDMITQVGSLVYMHTPTPVTQLQDEGQTYENVLPHHYVVKSMAEFGFELVLFQHDTALDCDHEPLLSQVGVKSLEQSRCNINGWPKYYHALFRKADDMRVFTLS